MAPLHDALEQLAALAAIRGDATGAARFSSALDLVRSQNLASDTELMSFLDRAPAGPDPDLLRHLRSTIPKGSRVLVELETAELPTDLRWLLASGAVSLKQLALLHDALGIVTVADLIAEFRRHAMSGVAGLDASVEGAVAATLPGLRARVPRIPLGRAVATVEPILNQLRATAGVVWAESVGSLRRGQDLVGDIEIVASVGDPSATLAEIAALPEIETTRYRAPRRIYFVIDRVQVGIRCPERDAAGATLLQLTGSPSHVDRLYRLARDRRLSLDPGGLRSTDHGRAVASSEEEIYNALDLPFIAPELRNGEDEIDLAQRNRLPSLIARSHIRGDLHMHSQWSDGRDSIEAMVQGCIALGYDYLAITDHSQHSAASRNLALDDVGRQADEIASLRERYPQIAILHGCEVDILPNGRLDFSDRVLRVFDIVLASLHEPAGQSPGELLRRYLSAMANPLVSMVTHPMNRMLPQRRGYDLDFDRLCEGAVHTCTVLEIDGAPSHLDLEAPLARRAIDAGALVAIDSDAHRSEMLERHMTLGLLTARRGRVERRHVLNALPLPEFRALIAAKRQG